MDYSFMTTELDGRCYIRIDFAQRDFTQDMLETLANQLLTYHNEVGRK